jgi:DNA-binding GntR family transcriptional regulator
MTGSRPSPALPSIGFDRLSDRAYSQLHQAITEGEIAAGTRLTELRLCKLLKMGRSPVREALLRLAGDGLVEAVPNAGFFVRCITLEDIEESYQIRLALECLAVRVACQKGFSDLRLMDLERACERASQSSLDHDPRGAELADLQFHQALIALANSRRLEAAVRSNHLQIFNLQPHPETAARQETTQRVLDEHLQILSALRRRDARATEKILNDHILGSFQNHLKNNFAPAVQPATVPHTVIVGNLASMNHPVP